MSSELENAKSEVVSSNCSVSRNSVTPVSPNVKSNKIGEKASKDKAIKKYMSFNYSSTLDMDIA